MPDPSRLTFVVRSDRRGEGASIARREGDPLAIWGAAYPSFRVLNCTITQREQETATQARFRLLRRSTADTTAASGSVGGAKHNQSDASAGFSCTMNRTASSPTLGTEAGVVAIANESLPNGVRYLPTPEERQLFCGSGQYAR